MGKSTISMVIALSENHWDTPDIRRFSRPPAFRPVKQRREPRRDDGGGESGRSHGHRFALRWWDILEKS